MAGCVGGQGLLNQWVPGSHGQCITSTQTLYVSSQGRHSSKHSYKHPQQPPPHHVLKFKGKDL